MARVDNKPAQLVLPHDISAEQAVLGGLMLDNTRFDEIVDVVSDMDFFSSQHRLIYRAIKGLSDKGKPFDAVTLGDFLDSRGVTEQAGGNGYTIDLVGNTPSAANIMAYAQIVHDKANLRRIIEAGDEIKQLGFNPDALDVNDVLAQAMERVFRLAQREESSSIKDGRTVLLETIKEMQLRAEMGDRMLGIPTSIEDLDEALGGLQAPDLIIIAARPGMGKTVLMQQMARSAARHGKRPYIVTMEMGSSQLSMRDIAAEARVDHKLVKSAALDSEDTVKIHRAIEEMQDWERYFDDANSLTLERLTSRIRRMVRQHGVGVVFIDYLQIMDLDEQMKLNRGNFSQAVGTVTRKLKSLAKELHIPIVLLSQLNRSLESRSDKRPLMSDLRESGAIEQDADIILFIYRDAYYDKKLSPLDLRHDVTEIIIAKQRSGGVGKVLSLFRANQQRFENLAADEPWVEQYLNPPEKKNDGPSRGFQRSGAKRTGFERSAGAED